MSLLALDIKPGDAVITTPFTFIATAEMIALLGAIPIFTDINSKTFNMDPELIEKDKINILWMHHFINQKEAQNLSSSDYIKKLDWIVYNSNWNLEKHIYLLVDVLRE